MKRNFQGLIVNPKKTNVFTVKKCPKDHVGQGRVLVNWEKRDRAKRFEIVRIVTPEGKQALAAIIGLDNKELIKMDWDLRAELGLNLDQKTSLEISKAGILGTLYWYVTVRNPHIRITAIITMVSLVLGIFGFVSSFF